jgi:flagella basal body P-ring formation protein FlgA
MVRSSKNVHPSVVMLILFVATLWLPGIAEPATKIQAEDIKVAISDYVERNHSWPAGSVRVNFPSKLSDIALSQESVTFEVAGRPETDFIGDAYLTVKFYSAGTTVKEETVRISVEVLTDIVVSNREFVKNTIIADEDVRVLKKWLRRIPANAITNPSDVVGKVLTLNTRQNSEITKNIIRAPSLVKKGNVVRIVLDNYSLNITTIGISEEDGAMDKVIRVKPLSSNRAIYARVTGDSQVSVEFQ